MKSKRASLVCAGVLAVFTLLSSSSPASAASQSFCSNSACDGADPISSGCSADAITAATLDGVEDGEPFKIELRYSPSCRSAWARGTGPRRSATIFIHRVEGKPLEIHSAKLTASSGGSYRNWTDMVDDAGSKAIACYKYTDSSTACTDRY